MTNPNVMIDEDWTPPSPVDDLPWAQLQVGKGSFKVKGTKTSQLSGARQKAERQLNAQFKTKLSIENNESWIRVWRIR